MTDYSFFFFFLIIFSFFAFFMSKPLISEAIKSLHYEKKSIIIQKCLSFIFRDGGNSVPSDSGDIQKSLYCLRKSMYKFIP